jgi:hypothetical protein
MDESIGPAAEPTTQADAPDIRHRTDDDQPRSHRTPPRVDDEDTALSDPARRRTDDPLDPHRPSRETNDPLDPDGHVI